MPENKIYTMSEVFPNAHSGQLLRGYRVREGITQGELAQLLEISCAELDDIESGQTPITKKFVHHIEVKTGIGVNVFLKGGRD